MDRFPKLNNGKPQNRKRQWAGTASKTGVKVSTSTGDGQDGQATGRRPEFSYRQLNPEQNEIRVLELQPGSPNDPICATTRHVLLREDPVIVYETISYCWGRDTLESRLIIDQALLPIPISAYRALKSVRLQGEIRTVWIDSVCIIALVDADRINQRDDVERGQQVAIMDQIYSLGMRNLVYLGDDDCHADDIKVALETLDKEVQRETDGYARYLPMIKPEGRGQVVEWGHSLKHPEIWYQVLVKSLSLPWFSRLWVVQEATLARSNICIYGRKQIDLRIVLQLAVWILHKYSGLIWSNADRKALTRAADLFELANKDYGQIHHRYFGRNVQTSRNTMIDLLEMLAEYDVTDARDRVYGMLGLLRYCTWGDLLLAMRPDYEKSVAEVFTEAALIVIRERGRLSPLNRVYQGSKQLRLELQLPSWVPLWESRDNLKDPATLRYDFSADDHQNVRLVDEDTVHSGSIRLQGFLFASVRHCERACDSATEWAELLRGVIVGVGTQSSLSSSYGKTALYTTLHADSLRSIDDGSAPETSKDLEGLEEVVEFLCHNDSNEATKALFPERGALEVVTGNEELVNMRRLAQGSYNACARRRFFHLSNGAIGLGPKDMQEGDLVVILYGGSKPFVLREIEDVEGSYHFVGPAYVHGIMYGEAMRRHERSGKPGQTFCLK